MENTRLPRWENEMYCVLDQPSPGIPLHRNLPVPINHLPLDDGTTNVSNTPAHPNNTSGTVTHAVNDEEDCRRIWCLFRSSWYGTGKTRHRTWISFCGSWTCCCWASSTRIGRGSTTCSTEESSTKEASRLDFIGWLCNVTSREPDWIARVDQLKDLANDDKYALPNNDWHYIEIVCMSAHLI